MAERSLTFFVPKAARKARWLAVLVLISVLTVAAVHVVNRYVHQPYVTFGGPRRNLRLMTWNVGRVYLRGDSRASDQDLEYVARVIRDMNPHAVALQEIRGPGQLTRLVAMLGRNWRGRVPQDSYDRRAALLLRVRGRFFELPTSTGRTAQAAIVRLPGDRHVTIVSVHLDAFDPKRRLQQAEEIVAGAERLGSGEVFLAGDFNCDQADPTRETEDQRLYRFLTDGYVDAARAAGTTTLAARRLDYVFCRTPMKLVGARVLRSRRIDSLDHHPLLTEFALE